MRNCYYFCVQYCIMWYLLNLNKIFQTICIVLLIHFYISDWHCASFITEANYLLHKYVYIRYTISGLILMILIYIKCILQRGNALWLSNIHYSILNPHKLSLCIRGNAYLYKEKKIVLPFHKRCLRYEKQLAFNHTIVCNERRICYFLRYCYKFTATKQEY